MTRFEETLKRIAELAKKAVSKHDASTDRSMKYLSEALEEVTNAVKAIEQRLQRIEQNNSRTKTRG